MAGLIIVALVLIVAGIGYWLWARQYESTDDAFIDGHVVQVASKVSGYVDRLRITDNELVQEGQLLLEIDPRDYETALAKAEAAAASAADRLQESEAQIAAAEADAIAEQATVVATEASNRNAQQDLDRYRQLAPQGAASQQSFDAALATAKSSAAQETAQRAKAGSAESQVRLAKAQEHRPSGPRRGPIARLRKRV